MKLSLKLITYLSLIIFSVISIAYVSILDSKVVNKLDGVLWTVPAKVYARPLELAEGGKINVDVLKKELEILSYELTKGIPDTPGEFSQSQRSVNIFIRGFGSQEPGLYRLKIENDKIDSIKRKDGISIDLIQLEPLSIGGMFPSHLQDRILLNFSQVPKDLEEMILVVEDRNFYSHKGISLRSIMRAFIKNTRALGIEEGGSTITQQLAKSLFFSPEQTIKRKIKEAIAALLIEIHYSKQEILLAYINDVFIAQSGRRAIHGFGLASQFFFGTDLKNLSLDQKALLVGMLKGPSLYSPINNPDRAKTRRDLVLSLIKNDSLITEEEYLDLKGRSLKVIPPSFKSLSKYPAFNDIVTLDLRKNFDDSDLRTKGLKIITNLDPVVQDYLEESIKDTKLQLKRRYGSQLNGLEGAGIVIDSFSGEVVAAIGSTKPNNYGFNRAINAVRPIGSLVKPFIYLSALQHYSKYNLSTLLDDSKLSVSLPGGKLWEPNNFDKKFHGNIPLHVALSESYNVATTRLGMDLGYSVVQETFTKLGIKKKIPKYPSIFVGSFEMTPLEVIQAYQTIASEGFYSPLNSIRTVESSEDVLSLSYPYKVEQRFRPEPIYLLKFVLKQTFISGTARGFSSRVIEKWKTGGKTGTSDDQRDSWFVGYAGNYLMVVWLGFDDNRKSPLTGRTGALQVWKNFMSRLDPIAYEVRKPSRIRYEWVDTKDGLLSGERCKGSILIPFVEGTEPEMIPQNRKKCRISEESYTAKVLNKIKEAIEVK
ncbi:MAG TPA: penicillin-binding protein 1B [Gammaproteobacteria bacterium]|jgi:penicillin-binding protein 1B|nr:penicillin-binding protein 1B [Gammaproteobacteria bacterium]HIB75434.1 penicillin-binding protein 1B [Gammaproteobacteria bacterium]HIM22008.1 penicillin-binding protein 1B [Gammaproteobacteria bacterium]HIO04902.1 penicillin-binding protein 1B [Gammaproteobacteria bacterium]